VGLKQLDTAFLRVLERMQRVCFGVDEEKESGERDGNRDIGDEEAGVGFLAMERDTEVDVVDMDRVKSVLIRRIECAQDGKEIGEPAVAAMKSPEIDTSKEEEEEEEEKRSFSQGRASILLPPPDPETRADSRVDISDINRLMADIGR
jgi:hypothetical protein